MKRLMVSWLCLLSTFNNAWGFFFGNHGCTCAPSCPVYTPCAAAPLCYTSYSDCSIYSSPYASPAVVQDCCATCATPCKSKYVRQIFSHKRQKRDDDEDEVNKVDDSEPSSSESETPYDPKCNSERLRSVIAMSKGRDITIIKRNIQLLAEKQFNSKYNVICSSEGDFSYITNTEEHCQEVINGNTCYLFKQSKRSSKML